MSDITPEAIQAIAATVRCTCTPAHKEYAKAHSVYCAQVAAPEALKAIVEAAAPVLATLNDANQGGAA